MKSKAQNPSRGGGVKVKAGGGAGGVFGTSAAVVDRRCWIHQKIRFIQKKKKKKAMKVTLISVGKIWIGLAH